MRIEGGCSKFTRSRVESGACGKPRLGLLRELSRVDLERTMAFEFEDGSMSSDEASRTDVGGYSHFKGLG